MSLLKPSVLFLISSLCFASSYKLNFEINHSGMVNKYKNIVFKDGEKKELLLNGAKAIVGLSSDKDLNGEALKLDVALKPNTKDKKTLNAEILLFVGDQAEFETVDNKTKESLNIIVEASE